MHEGSDDLSQPDAARLQLNGLLLLEVLPAGSMLCWQPPTEVGSSVLQSGLLQFRAQKERAGSKSHDHQLDHAVDVHYLQQI